MQVSLISAYLVAKNPNVFFDVTIGGQAAGRIVIVLSLP